MKKIIAIAFLLSISGMYGMECEEEGETVRYTLTGLDGRKCKVNLPPNTQAKQLIELIKEFKKCDKTTDIRLILKSKNEESRLLKKNDTLPPHNSEFYYILRNREPEKVPHKKQRHY